MGTAGVPFNRGCAIYLISKFHPYSQTVRDTDSGWVDVCDWVISKYPEFKEIFEKIEN